MHSLNRTIKRIHTCAKINRIGKSTMRDKNTIPLVDMRGEIYLDASIKKKKKKRKIF